MLLDNFLCVHQSFLFAAKDFLMWFFAWCFLLAVGVVGPSFLLFSQVVSRFFLRLQSIVHLICVSCGLFDEDNVVIPLAMLMSRPGIEHSTL